MKPETRQEVQQALERIARAMVMSGFRPDAVLQGLLAAGMPASVASATMAGLAQEIKDGYAGECWLVETATGAEFAAEKFPAVGSARATVSMSVWGEMLRHYQGDKLQQVEDLDLDCGGNIAYLSGDDLTALGLEVRQ